MRPAKDRVLNMASGIMARSPWRRSHRTKPTRSAAPTPRSVRACQSKPGCPESDDEAPGHRAEPKRREDRPADIEVPFVGGAVGRDVTPGQESGAEGERQVDEEHRPPANPVDQPTSEDRSDGGGRRTRGGPSAHRTPPGLSGERVAEDGQAVRQEERGSDALSKPGRDEDREVRCQATGKRGGREQEGPEYQGSAASDPVAERPAQEKQCGERQEVAVDHPLQACRAATEIPTQRGQPDIHHRPVDEGEARREDAGR